MANTLAYYDMAIITAVKSFIVQAPGPSVLNFLWTKLTNVRNNLECMSLAGLSGPVYCLRVRPQPILEWST